MAEPNGSATPTVNVQVAARNATNYLQNLAPHIGSQITDVRLEEIELSEDEKFWFITLGFNRPINDPFTGILQPQTQRDYKQFKIDAETGKVKAMKIRAL